MRIPRLLSASMALVAATAALGLSGCSSGQNVVNGVAESAKIAAQNAARAALAPALAPLLELLQQAEAQLKAGNWTTAAASMAGFQPLWAKAAPLIQPLAGDSWSAIETAANAVIGSFAAGAKADAAAAGSAISGLIAALQALLAQ